MSNPRVANSVFVALDTPDLSRALELARLTGPHVGGLKLGLEFITALGPEGVRAVTALGFPVFADVKFHDIPNTVARAAKAIASLGVSMFNVHASGGEAMLRAAADAGASAHPPVLVLGVTVLTSLADGDLSTVGQTEPVRDQVIRLARLARHCGLDGVVCSPLEIAAVREVCGTNFLIVTPGVRPAGTKPADQRRVMTPWEAISAGADILVIGRPITDAPDPAEAAGTIVAEIKKTI